ncbi:MAG: 2OG-Fe(II) oxygenase [Hyphomonadaceae bacterium]
MSEDFAALTARLERESAAGDGAATARRAHLLAAGLTGPADWDAALALLRKAGAQGDVRAAKEAELIRGGHLDVATAIRAFVAPRPLREAHASPRIAAIPDFMSPAECAWMMTKARALLEPARVYDNQGGGGAVVDARSNSAAEFSPELVDMALVLLRARIAHTLGVPPPHLELTNVLHYAPGQRFDAHYDYMDAANPGLAASLARKGQRIITFLVYLNEDFEGGETEFPRLQRRFRGQAGEALVFVNAPRGGSGDARTLHAGLPPTRGEKWLLSQWVRDKPQV